MNIFMMAIKGLGIVYTFGMICWVCALFYNTGATRRFLKKRGEV